MYSIGLVKGEAAYFQVLTPVNESSVYSKKDISGIEVGTTSSVYAVAVDTGAAALYAESKLTGKSANLFADTNNIGFTFFDELGNQNNYRFPTDTGSVGQFLGINTNDGTGNTTLSWQTQTGVGGCEISCGTYTPTLTNTANLDGSTAFECQYMRVGNTVTVSGAFNADATAPATATSLRITLPIASNLSGGEQVGGTGATVNATTSEFAAIVGNLPNDEATIQWISTDVTEQFWSFSFNYQILP